MYTLQIDKIYRNSYLFENSGSAAWSSYESTV